MNGQQPVSAFPTIESLLAHARELDASDVHLRSNATALMRVDGSLGPTDAVFSEAALSEFVRTHVKNEAANKYYVDHKEMDAAATIADHKVGRVRIHANPSLNGTSVNVRLLQETVPTLAQVNAPRQLEALLDRHQGMILVTGPTGSGKSTLLAAMVDFINGRHANHIYTVEDPIEYIHPAKKCHVTQREVGHHTPSFPEALRGGLRADPDVILVGEMRDLDTMQTALTAAETGHLVLATLHSNDAAQTITRYVDVFPAGVKDLVRVQLADTLLAVVSVRLVPLAVGKGRRAVHEVLIVNAAVRTMIRDNQTNKIRDAIFSGKGEGQQTMQRVLLGLVDDGIITRDTAEAHAINIDELHELESSSGARPARVTAH